MEKICPLQGRDAGEAVIKIPAETLLVNHGQHILALMLALCTMYYTIYMVYYALGTLHYARCTMQYAQCTVHWVLCSLHGVLCTVYYARCTLHCVLRMVHYVLVLKTLKVKPGQHPLEVPA